MAKIFISYKHRDGQVEQIPNMIVPEYGITTARSYVDILDPLLTQLGHICKAEDSGEDIGDLSEDVIAQKLADRMYDSTVTIVLISKKMNDGGLEKKQWIPWEISYSLKEKTREDRTSATNAMLAVVLPDEYGKYDYFIESLGCPHCYGIRWKVETLFPILGKNMFNRKQPNITICRSGVCGTLHTGNDHSYIHPVRWDHFISDINSYINHVISINENIDDYKLEKVLS